MIAFVASAVGNCIVNVPLVTVLSAPKATTATALLDCDELYIKAPFAVKEADVKLTSAKSQIAVVLSVVGVTLVNVAPPDVYAVPEEFVISFVAEKAVVPAPKVAELVYKAILKVFPVVAVKLCVPTKSSCLKLVQIADVIAII